MCGRLGKWESLNNLRFLRVTGDCEDPDFLVHDGLADEKTSELCCSGDDVDNHDHRVADVTVHGGGSL